MSQSPMIQLTPEDLSQAFLVVVGQDPLMWPEVLGKLTLDQWELVELLLDQILETRDNSSVH